MTTAQSSWVNVACNLDDKVRRHLIAYAQSSPDEEVCGFIVDGTSIITAQNVADNPSHAWRMETQFQVEVGRKYGDRITAIFHSHPNGNIEPSDKDCDGIGFLYQQGCPWSYLIIANDEIFSYVYYK